MKTEEQWNDEFDAKYGIEKLDEFIRAIQADATQGGQVIEALKYCVDVIECNLKTDDRPMFKWARRLAYPPNADLRQDADSEQGT